jgi:ribosome-associated protein
MALEAEVMAVEIAKALDGKKAENIRVYDVRGVSNLTDMTVVATGTSAPHLKALIAETQRRMKELGVASYRTSGTPDSGWVVVDYVHAVAHVFSAEARDYYAIEKLWATAKEIPLPQA